MIILAYCVCTVASFSASAREPVDAGKELPSITVKFRDLDLKTDVGSRELLKRLSKAADRVCWRYARAGNAVGLYEAHACYERTLAVAVARIHQAHLSALFAASAR